MNKREVRMAQGLCPYCGFEKEEGHYMCADCARIKAQQAKERKYIRKPKHSSIDDICIKAKEKGLSYGKYLARYGNNE